MWMLKFFFEQGKKIPLHFMGAEFFVCRLGQILQLFRRRPSEQIHPGGHRRGKYFFLGFYPHAVIPTIGGIFYFVTFLLRQKSKQKRRPKKNGSALFRGLAAA
jgi:hypothetical protein